jgi:hypothetical protein
VFFKQTAKKYRMPKTIEDWEAVGRELYLDYVTTYCQEYIKMTDSIISINYNDIERQARVYATKNRMRKQGRDNKGSD